MVQGELLLLLAIHLALTALPGVAVALFAASRGERREPVLLAIFLAASGAAAMATVFLLGFVAVSWGGRQASDRSSFARSPLPSSPNSPA